MQELPKCDLHIHLGGSWPMSFLETIGTPDDITNLKSFLQQMELKDGTDYHACFNVFTLVGKIVNTIGKIENGTAALCRSIAADGVSYVEIRTGLKDFGSGYEEYLKAVLRGTKDGCEGTSLQVKWLLSLKRKCSMELGQETIRLIQKYGTDGVVGLDISDDALLGDGSTIFAIMEEVHSLDIPVALHLGECKEETEAQQMKELELIKPRRIGHGVFLTDKAKEYVYSRRLPIEMCLSSAVVAHMVEDAAHHPSLQLIKQGYPVIVCTDDPLVFNTTHTKESTLASTLLGYTVAQMGELHQMSLKYKFG